MADRILVPFQGEGAGPGALSWGQRELWYSMRQKHTWMPMSVVRRLPSGTTVEGIAEDLRFLMEHYPALRTRLRLDSDRPSQVVTGSGTVELEVVDADRDADPAWVAEQVRHRYCVTDYDFVEQWPVRMAVVRHGGIPTHRVWVMCHLVADAAGASIMESELAARDASGSAASATPLEQTRWQGSPAGQRQCALALRNFDRLLHTVPARRFRPPGRPARPRYWNGTFTSAALPLAVNAIAARTRASTSAVLLAVFAIALSRVAGIDPVVARVVVSNRFRPDLARTVSPIVQNGLVVLDVASTTVDEAVAHVWHQAVVAYKRAYYDPVQFDHLMASMRRERGEDIDLGCFFNDRRQRQRNGQVPAPDEVRKAQPRTTFRWDEKQDNEPYEPLFVTIDDTPDGLAVLVYIDTSHISPADAEACMRTMDAVAVAAVAP